MRRISFALAILGIAGVLFFSGCALNSMVKMAKDQDIKVTPNPLELHGDKVTYEVSATLPAKMLKKNLVYALDSKYEYEGQSEDLDRIEFVANEFPNSDTQQPRMVETFSFDYKEGMGNGNLMFTGTAIDPNKGQEVAAVPPTPLARGLITTSKLVKEVHYAAFVSYDYSDDQVKGFTPNEELEPTKVDFYFLQGSSVLRSSERRSDRGKFFQAFIAEKNVTRTVTITGTHSPEGSETINSNLAQDRAKVIEDYYSRMMNRYDYKGMADSIKFVLKPVVEDWAALKMKMDEYDKISSSEKLEWVNIITGMGSFEEKEKKLQKLPTYKKVFNDIYPDLRTAKTEILTVIEKKSDAEIAILAKMIVEGKAPADTLTYGEMAYAAHLTPSLSEKEAIYKVATKQYPHFASHNNLGAVYLAQAIEAVNAGDDPTGKAEMSATQFEISLKSKSTNPYAQGNLGVAYAMQGKVDQGYDAIARAAEMNPPVKHAQGFNGVKGVIEVKKAEYDDAVKTLSIAKENCDNLFNKGLAHLLKKDYDIAKNTFTEVTEMKSDYALAYYTSAITAARMGDAAELVTSLKKAIDADPSLKQKALGDLEFVKYVDSEGFRNAIR